MMAERKGRAGMTNSETTHAIKKQRGLRRDGKKTEFQLNLAGGQPCNTAGG